MRRFRESVLAVAGLALVAIAAGPAAAAYPDRPLTLIVPWGAGGGTDATGRMIASLLEKDLGQPVNVVNRTGGSGVVGHAAIATAKPDGYTLGVLTVEITMMHWAGLTDLTHAAYTPLALYNADPAGLQVRSDSPYKSARELLDAIKANPGKMKASGTGQGGSWHLALAGMLFKAGIDANAAPWVPSQGAAPSLQDLVAGGIDIVTCSVVEARSMMEAGKVRSLAVMDEKRIPAFPDVPALKEAAGIDWSMAAWRGIGGPKGMSKEAVDRIVPALKKVYDSKEFQEFMNGRGFGLIWKGPDEYAAFMAQSDKELGAVMKGTGIAK